MFENWEQQLFILSHVTLAAILSGLIGVEREFAKKPAGLRTNMVIGASAALLVLVGDIFMQSFIQDISSDKIKLDPLRIIESVIVGVSFIGAGTILQSEKKMKIRNLTTAASTLLSAGVGITVALQQYIVAGGIAVIALAINLGLRKVDETIQEEQD